MELLFLMGASLLLWPWWGLGLFILLLSADAILIENDCEGWGTLSMLIIGGLLVYFIGDTNPLTFTWNNLGAVLLFIFYYFIIGGWWSIIKWYFYLLKVRDRMKQTGETKRGKETFAENNKARISSWIGHWPMSIIGTLFGDFLFRIVTNIYNILGTVYDRIGNSVFSDLTAEDERKTAQRQADRNQR